MATAIAIALLDAQGTPVTHTFVPIGIDKDNVFWFEDQSQSNPVGYWRISVEQKKPSVSAKTSQDQTYRTKIALHEPVLDNITNSTVTGVLPAPSVAYVPRSFHEFVMPQRASLLDRQNMTKMAPLLLQNAQIVALLNNFTYLQ